MEAPTLIVAFFAGMTLFISPCIAPLIPAYLASISGVRWSELSQKNEIRWQVMKNALAFVVGFSLIFILAGMLLSFLSSEIIGLKEWINRIGGLLILVLALHMLELINIPFLNREFNATGKVSNKGQWYSSALMGSTFGLAWTPCTGPILALILSLSANTGSVSEGSMLMVAFSSGLALPFLLTGAFSASVSSWLMKNRHIIVWFNRVAAVLLIVLGIYIFTGRIETLLGAFFNFFNFST
jgi:cytochrome c-type biogenesis protein